MSLIVITISDESNGGTEIALKSLPSVPSNPPTPAEIMAARMINAVTKQGNESVTEPSRIQLLN